MKILQIGSDNMPSNSANNKQIQSMRRGFLDLGHSVILLSFRNTIHKKQSPVTKQMCSVFVGDFGRITNTFKRLCLKWLVRRFQPDFVYTRVPSYAAICAAMGSRVVLEVHEILSEKQIASLLTSGVKKVVLLSKATMAREHTTHFDLQLLPQGFDKQYFDQFEHSPKDLRYSFGESSDYVLYFGAIGEDRGVPMLLECAKRLPHLMFVFAGRVLSGFQWPEDLPRNVVDLGFLSPKEYIPLILNARLHVIPYSKRLINANNVSSLRLYELLYTDVPILVSDIQGMRQNPMIKDWEAIFVPSDSLECWISRIESECVKELRPSGGREMVRECDWVNRSQAVVDFGVKRSVRLKGDLTLSEWSSNLEGDLE